MRKIKLSVHDGRVHVSFNLVSITMARVVNRYALVSGLGRLPREFTFSTDGASAVINQYHALADSMRGSQKEIFLREIAQELEAELQARLPRLAKTG